MELFARRDIEQYTDSLADYMPNGRLFAAKSIKDTNFRKLLRGLSWELFRANGFLRDYDILPDTTEKFLSEWESALGIPDDCFLGTGTFAERRRDILVKLASSGIQTEQDFIDLAALFGITITISTDIDVGSFPYTFPLTLVSEKESRFIIIIEFTVEEASRFTLTFPFTFGGELIAILECLFNKLKPANVIVLFEQV